jgi:hypothetical protein
LEPRSTRGAKDEEGAFVEILGETADAFHAHHPPLEARDDGSDAIERELGSGGIVAWTGGRHHLGFNSEAGSDQSSSLGGKDRVRATGNCGDHPGHILGHESDRNGDIDQVEGTGELPRDEKIGAVADAGFDQVACDAVRLSTGEEIGQLGAPLAPGPHHGESASGLPTDRHLSPSVIRTPHKLLNVKPFAGHCPRPAPDIIVSVSDKMERWSSKK